MDGLLYFYVFINFAIWDFTGLDVSHSNGGKPDHPVPIIEEICYTVMPALIIQCFLMYEFIYAQFVIFIAVKRREIRILIENLKSKV